MGQTHEERRSFELGPTEFVARSRITSAEVHERVVRLLERVVPAA